MPTEQVLLILWLVLSYLAIFIGWRFPGHYHFPVLPPLSILAGQAFSRFVAEQRCSPQPRWRWIRTGIIGAAALPAIGFLVCGLRSANADAQFSPDCSAHRQGDEPERSYLCLGKLPATLQFLRPADGDAFRELLTLGWRLRQPASRGER